MRDTHRMREKYDLSLDSRQVVSLLIGGIVVLGAVFVLGVLVGKKLAGTPRADRGPDLLTALDHKSDALERARASPPLTFQEELTRPSASAPAMTRPQATSGPTPAAGAAPTIARAPAATTSAPAATASVTASGAPAASASASKTSPPTASVAASGAPTASASPSKASPPTASVAASGAPTASASPSKASPPTASVAASGAPTASASASKASPSTGKTDPEKRAEPARPAHSESVVTRTAPAAAHPVPPKVPEATSATGAFTLQLGASPSRDDAERQASRLREKGYAPYIVSAEVPGKGTWYRVRMGSFPTKDAATRYLQDFRRETQAEAFVASTK